MATPDTIWLPRLVIEAKPWINEISTDTVMPESRPSQGEPVMKAATAEALQLESQPLDAPIGAGPLVATIVPADEPLADELLDADPIELHGPDGAPVPGAPSGSVGGDATQIDDEPA